MNAAGFLQKKLGSLRPEIALVLGSGLGGIVEAVEEPRRISFRELPGFPESGVSGHAGEVVAGYLAGSPIIMLSGRVHYYEQGDAGAMRPVIETLAEIGAESLVLTNSAGSLESDMGPGSVMLIEDHINFSGTNPLLGEPTDRRFVGLTEAYDLQWKTAIEKAAAIEEIRLHKGVYMWFSGPSFETPAEIRMARLLGANAVGMSTVPEVILARFCGLRVAACSVITNFAAGMTGMEISHEETKHMAPAGGKKLALILARAIGEMA